MALPRNHRRWAWLALLVCVTGLLGLAGCGGSDDGSQSEEAVELRIDREREEAAALARQEQRVERLRAEVKRLKGDRAVEAGAAAASASPATESSSSMRTFHAPTGNVSCEITESSARCTVSSIGQTFALSSGSAAQMESGIAVAKGAGATVGWGESISVGQIRCSIPLEDEPRGITCDDTASGHGFEASRVPARQRTY